MGILRYVLDDGRDVQSQINVTKMRERDRERLLKNILQVVEEDNEKFLRTLKDRTDRSFRIVSIYCNIKRTMLLIVPIR